MTGQAAAWLRATVCGAVIVAVSMGIRQTFGVFVLPIGEALGLGREPVGLTLAVQNLAFGLGLPVVGALADRRGARGILAAGALVYAAGLATVTLVREPWALLVTLGVLVGLAQSATTFVVVFGALGRLVPAERRGLAFGLVTAGGSVGMFAFVPAVQLLLSGLGWQMALLCLAVVALLITVAGLGLTAPGARAVAAHSATESLGAVLAGAARHPGYLLLNAGFFVCGFHVAFVATHLPAYLADAGLAPVIGASALALIGLGNIFGSYWFGTLGDRRPKQRVLAAIYLGRAVVFGLFLVLPVTTGSALMFGLMIGLLWLGTVPLTSGVVAQIFGVRYLGTLYGIVFLWHQVGAFLGAWLGGAVYDRAGSYLPVWVTAIGLSLVAAAIHWILDVRPARQVMEQPA